MFSIDWVLRLGDVIIVLGFAGTILLSSYKVGKLASAFEGMQKEIISLKDVAKSVADVLTTVAVQKSEIAHIRDDVDELRKATVTFKTKNVK